MAQLPSLERFTRRQFRESGCWFVRVSKQLSDDERTELDAALADRSITSKTICTVLAEDFSFQITARTISSHRTGMCSCE